MIINNTPLSNSPLLWNHRDSLRRHFVDDFYMRKITTLPKGGRVLDLGGNRQAKRGLFNIDSYKLDVVYANCSAKQSPDILADALALPFSDASFDSVVCVEVLEHIRIPLKSIRRNTDSLMACRPSPAYRTVYVSCTCGPL